MMGYNLVKFQLYINVCQSCCRCTPSPFVPTPHPTFPLVATNLFSLSTFLNSSYEWQKQILKVQSRDDENHINQWWWEWRAEDKFKSHTEGSMNSPCY